MLKHSLIALVATTCLASTASADAKKMHVNTDIVSWDKPMTEAQCLDKAKAAITAADSKLKQQGASHAVVGTKTDWVVGVDCMQSYKVNAAYVVISYFGGDVKTYDKIKTAVSTGLEGKSEMLKN